MMDKKLIRIPVYIAFGLVAFFIALAVTFPDEQLKDIAVVQIQNQLPSNYDVTVDDLDIWWFTGIALEDVRIEERITSTGAPNEQDAQNAPGAAGAAGGAGAAGEGGDGSEGEQQQAGPQRTPFELDIPQIGARFAPLSSLFNLGLAANFEVWLGGGSVDGTFVQGRSSRSVDVDINDVRLADSPLLAQLTGLPTSGELDGYADLAFTGAGQPVLTEGDIELNGDELILGPAKIKTEAFPMAFLEVPETNLGELSARLGVQDQDNGAPKLVVEDFRLDGEDLRAQMWGDVTLGRTINSANARLELRTQIDQKFVDENSLGPIFRARQFRNGKKGNWYGFVLWGGLTNLQFKGATTAATGPPQEDEGNEENNGSEASEES